MIPPIDLSGTNERRVSALVVVVVVVAGAAAGWFMRPPVTRYFDYVYALVEPTGLAAACVSMLARQVTAARWFVPLLLISVMLNVATRPQTAALSAFGIAAGLVAVVAIPLHGTRLAMAAAALCGVSITASLLTGLYFE